jgi:hypothetical protein
MKFLRYLLFPLLAVCAAIHAVDAESSAMPAIPLKAATAAALVPKGWALETTAQADLNQDGRKDLALVITKKGARADNPDFEVTRRLLVLALRQKDGTLERSAVSDSAVLNSDEGGVWGDPFVEIQFERGALVIRHYGGSNWRWRTTARYRFQDGHWMLIGRTDENTFNGDAEYRDDADHNLSSGQVIRHFKPVQDRGNEEPATNREKLMTKQSKVNYWQVPAPFTTQAPSLDGQAAAGEWPLHALKLNRQEQVITSDPVWKGPSDSSAILRAVCTRDSLFLRIEVTDDEPTPGDRLRLTTLGGSEVKPTKLLRVDQPNGYVMELSWSRKALRAALNEAYHPWLERESNEAPDSAYDAELPIVIEVLDFDEHQSPSILSTRPKGMSYAAGLLMMDPQQMVLSNSGQIE